MEADNSERRIIGREQLPRRGHGAYTLVKLFRQRFDAALQTLGSGDDQGESPIAKSLLVFYSATFNVVVREDFDRGNYFRVFIAAAIINIDGHPEQLRRLFHLVVTHGAQTSAQTIADIFGIRNRGKDAFEDGMGFRPLSVSNMLSGLAQPFQQIAHFLFLATIFENRLPDYCTRNDKLTPRVTKQKR